MLPRHGLDFGSALLGDRTPAFGSGGVMWEPLKLRGRAVYGRGYATVLATDDATRARIARSRVTVACNERSRRDDRRTEP